MVFAASDTSSKETRRSLAFPPCFPKWLLLQMGTAISALSWQFPRSNLRELAPGSSREEEQVALEKQMNQSVGSIKGGDNKRSQERLWSERRDAQSPPRL